MLLGCHSRRSRVHSETFWVVSSCVVMIVSVISSCFDVRCYLICVFRFCVSLLCFAFVFLFVFRFCVSLLCFAFVFLFVFLFVLRFVLMIQYFFMYYTSSSSSIVAQAHLMIPPTPSFVATFTGLSNQSKYLSPHHLSFSFRLVFVVRF